MRRLAGEERRKKKEEKILLKKTRNKIHSKYSFLFLLGISLKNITIVLLSYAHLDTQDVKDVQWPEAFYEC